MATATAVTLDSKRSVLGRVLDILECFTGTTEQSISSLCDETGLPAATVHRMLANLVESGAVERAGRGRYRLGRRLWRLGKDVPSIRGLRDAARPCLVDLRDLTSEVALLASLDSQRLLVLDVLAGRSDLEAWTAPRELPITHSAPGLALLANMPYDEALSWINKPVDDFKVRQQFGEIRRNGVAVARTGAMVWVSAPVFDESGKAFAAVTSVVPADRLNLPAITRVVSGAARAISQRLRQRATVGID
ncbi:IclR family transcriptional regulator [Nocardioides sp. Kera G14]|uniref:IclR family transcriptional regulator n=1 Tax=Nocardioides sp. Kera G14 TaxID=2884264 RepID=UPI001D0FC785|nr:helix-turn-helix domain-containing protein [Nocardioides sp. Kera G14]UDY24581.1 helix-turn-helix domain-containing protein [Nocardioides sp. Kera G14]